MATQKETKPEVAKATETAPTTPAVVKTEKNIVDNVLAKVQKFMELGEIKLHSDYSPENALKAAYLILQDTKDRDKNPVLQSCTKESIANSLLNMVVQGLSPMKKQCAFIAYGKNLTCVREYPGSLALVKRLANMTDFSANVVYEGDEFQYEVDPATGRKRVVKHVQKLENINIAKIKGAYAILQFSDKDPYVEIMTIQQIQQAWKQGDMKGASGAHTNFSDQMAVKSVINRACKFFINSSDDGNLSDESKDDQKAATENAIPEATETIEIQEAVEVHETAPVAEKATETTQTGPGF